MISLLASIFVFIAAIQMVRHRSRVMAMVAAIVSMVPCIQGCCLIGLPVGIWSIIVLSDAQVAAAFREESEKV